MKKFIFVLSLFYLVIFNTNVYAYDKLLESEIHHDMNIQSKISQIGFKILNSNKIEKRMAFVYNKHDKLIKGEPELTKRQIIVYDKSIQFADNDDEIAAFLAREISKTSESYIGGLKGLITSAQIKGAPKKYEIFFDKRAVDYLVMAGYNPLGLITFINKSYEQKRFDKISTHNLTSKRLANIYEYIYIKYPIFLQNNTYKTNEYYQNFLLNSIENREKLYQKVKTGSRQKIKYE